MQVVGRLGSYISKSICTVSGPFHPFGGAVDIIVVEQQDGSYKSSPWYVRFGKFQGVLRLKDKVVNISVNGVDADFHMYLDHKGQAYFLKEADIEEGHSACSPPSSSGEVTDRQRGDRSSMNSNGCDDDVNLSGSIVDKRKRSSMVRTNSRRSKILEPIIGRKDGSRAEVESIVVRTESLERAEIAVDLLELKWSTNLASSRPRKDSASRFPVEDVSKTGSIEKLHDFGCISDETGIISQNNYQELAVDDEEKNPIISEDTAEFAMLSDNYGKDIGVIVSGSVKEPNVISDGTDSCLKLHYSDKNIDSFPDTTFSDQDNAVENIQAIQDSNASEGLQMELKGSSEGIASLCCSTSGEVSVYPETNHDMAQSKSKEVPEQKNDVLLGHELVDIQEYLQEGHHQVTVVKEEEIRVSGETSYIASEITVGDSYPQMSYGGDVTPCISSPRIFGKEQLLAGNQNSVSSDNAKQVLSIHMDHENKETSLSISLKIAEDDNLPYHPKYPSGFSLEQFVVDDYIYDPNRRGRSLRTISSNVCFNRTGHTQSNELLRKVKSLPCMPLSDDSEAHDSGCSLNLLQHSNVKACPEDTQSSRALSKVEILNQTEEGHSKHSIGTPPRANNFLRRNGRSMSSESFKISQPDSDSLENSNTVTVLGDTSDLEDERNAMEVRISKRKVRTLTLTSEQLMSLKLKEGKNIVIFTFSTAMLGKQQVDARIFLWRWDNQIVISDVDGTITRSDLLGQVMPLVGMDWSQMGVAHLFSAIKENGYQLLFLSARSISQSFHTRQFLFKINQDGIALPDGPVVISPDGLFPSLFREVVRRAPHEFKVACLEDIKALFPADRKPFYAGFGNRDTDEFSYLKVGIPRGKIFTINPKGEIVVNRHIDTKSYVSLRGLVNSMFPPMSSCEQEDYNSWNYWKLPTPDINI